MPDSTSIAIAKAVTADLAAAQSQFGESYLAEFSLLPSAELKDLKNLKMSVRPGGDRMNGFASRNMSQHDYLIEVCLRQYVNGDDAAQAERLIRLNEQISDYFRFQKPTGRDERLIAVESTLAYDPDALDTQRVIKSTVVLAFRGFRS